MTAFPSNLITGYRTFHSGRFTPNRDNFKALREEGQTPETMVIACCDSRAAPEIIFDAMPGEMFVARNVANLVPPYRPDDEFHATSAALEFAVQSLKVKNIIVMGHGACGGIMAALSPSAEPLSPGDFIGKWMELLGPVAEEIAANKWLTDAERQSALERVSIRYSIANLMTFPCINILVNKDRLALHGAWFDIGLGELWTMDNDSGDFSKVET